MRYIKYYSRKNVSDKLFNEKSAAIILPRMTGDGIFILTEIDFLITENDIFINDISDLIPFNKPLKSTVECLFYDTLSKSIDVWIEDEPCICIRQFELFKITELDIFE